MRCPTGLRAVVIFPLLFIFCWKGNNFPHSIAYKVMSSGIFIQALDCIFMYCTRMAGEKCSSLAMTWKVDILFSKWFLQDAGSLQNPSLKMDFHLSVVR